MATGGGLSYGSRLDDLGCFGHRPTWKSRIVTVTQQLLDLRPALGLFSRELSPDFLAVAETVGDNRLGTCHLLFLTVAARSPDWLVGAWLRGWDR
jgi:hypothetical protein